ncbi:acyl carrier protein [Streptomyces albidoflavus]|uniref:acyl carrier protein n=1 Tax=Streptomyces albidoflavus TaxID=1886 RepID=UPI000FF2B7A4|nr:acyl carrier protein [Streptomyces albidoflavus]RWZ77677.1 acyl carrier protein [Streptomyces albidoflavus]
MAGSPTDGPAHAGPRADAPPPADPDLPAVLDIVRGLLADPPPAWGPEQADVALRDLGFDSLRTVNLLVAVEAALGVELPQERITADTFRTARTLADAVHETRHAHG